MLHTVLPRPLIHASVGLLLNTEAMLAIFGVLALVAAPVNPRIHAVPVFEVLDPFTFVGVAIGVHEPSLTAFLVVEPSARIR